MGDLINQLHGPYFSFLPVEKDKLWERRGRVQRIVGIKSEYYHHPDALRLPDCVISVFVKAFQHSHERFAYYGATIYESTQLAELIKQLQAHIDRINSYQDEATFNALLTELFVSDCKRTFKKRHIKWEQLQAELVESIEQITIIATKAQSGSNELLVLGV